MYQKLESLAKNNCYYNYEKLNTEKQKCKLMFSLIVLIYLYRRVPMYFKKDFLGRNWFEAATADRNNPSYDLVMYK